MNEAKEKNAAIKAYFTIRDLTASIVPDREYYRFHKPIATYDEGYDDKVTLEDIQRRISEEIIIVGIAIRSARHDNESMEREKEALEKMIARATDIYGIPKEKLQGKDEPKS